MLMWLGCLSFLASAALAVRVIRFRGLIDGLTLIGSWRWAVIAATTYCVAVFVSANFVDVRPGTRSLVQLAAVTLLLAPMMSNLGARNPGASAWQWFVVFPMILVLMWPGVSQVNSSLGRSPAELGITESAGIVIVILMTAGACLGTSMTIPALLFLTGIVINMLPLTGYMQADSPLLLFCPALFLICESMVRRRVMRQNVAINAASTVSNAIDETWQLFQDLYGLVWARRVQDRVNQFASREQWTVLLSMDGFRDNAGNSVPDAELEKPRDALRWALGRFAGEEWIRQRLFRLG
jgi:hypothetical protein